MLKVDSYITLKKGEETFFLCKIIIPSVMAKKEYILFVVNHDGTPSDLPAFSSIRRDFVDLTDEYTVEDVLCEDIAEMRKSDERILNMEKETYNSVVKTLTIGFEKIFPLS